MWFQHQIRQTELLILNILLKKNLPIRSSFPEAGTGATTPLDGSFHHFAMTWNDGDDTMRVYLDGVQTGSVAVATPTNNSLDMLFGQWASGPRQFLGVLDEISIYNRTPKKLPGAKKE